MEDPAKRENLAKVIYQYPTMGCTQSTPKDTVSAPAAVPVATGPIIKDVTQELAPGAPKAIVNEIAKDVAADVSKHL